LILVNGLPCSGKSTLARRVASHFHLPLYEKDQVKERLFDTLGWSDLAWSRKLSQASKAVLFYLLECAVSAGQSLILECNFNSQEDSQPLRARLEGKGYQVIQVVCQAPGEVLVERFKRRTGQRHPGHQDHFLLAEIETRLRTGDIQPLKIGGELLEVDASQPYAWEQVRHFLEAYL
jgi:predicted kinase